MTEELEINDNQKLVNGGNGGGKSRSEVKEKTFQFYKDFLTRVTKLEGLGSIGGRLLSQFQQGLDFLRRPAINKTSKLIENISRSNESKRLMSYIEAGSNKSVDTVESMVKLHTSLRGLQVHVIKARSILNELECLLEDVACTLKCSFPSPSSDKLTLANEVDQQATINEEDTTISHSQEAEIIDYAAIMAIIYSMMKQDNTMQEKIVASLNFKTSGEELEGYNLMWSLRPFVNVDVMHQAWRLIP